MPRPTKVSTIPSAAMRRCADAINQEKRKALCSEIQKILAEDLPYLPLWFNDVVSVHRRSLGQLDLSSSGDYNFLATLPYHTSQK